MAGRIVYNSVSLAPGCIVDRLAGNIRIRIRTYIVAISLLLSTSSHVDVDVNVNVDMGKGICVAMGMGVGKAAGSCQMRFVAAIVNMARNEERQQEIFAFFGSVSATWLGNRPGMHRGWGGAISDLIFCRA